MVRGTAEQSCSPATCKVSKTYMWLRTPKRRPECVRRRLIRHNQIKVCFPHVEEWLWPPGILILCSLRWILFQSTGVKVEVGHIASLDSRGGAVRSEMSSNTSNVWFGKTMLLSPSPGCHLYRLPFRRHEPYKSRQASS